MMSSNLLEIDCRVYQHSLNSIKLYTLYDYNEFFFVFD